MYTNFLIKIMKEKMAVSVLARFCGRAADSAQHMHFLRLLREDWGVFQNGVYVEGERRHWIIRFLGIYIEISQLGPNVIKMAL